MKQLNADLFTAYTNLLLRENAKYNLTAITDPAEIRQKHFSDSLSILDLDEFKQWYGKTQRSGLAAPQVLDVGSGAGFPGVPLAIARPGLRVTLLESTGKKANFLRMLADELALPLTVINARAEEAAHDPALREAFGLVVSRAVAALPVLCELCLPFAAVGGVFAAYKGTRARAEEELAAAARAIALLGGKLRTIESETSEYGERTLILIDKVSATQAKYPRNHGLIIKKAL